MSEELKQFINKNKSLFWYTPESELLNIDDSFLIETILNYGDWNAVKELFKILGIKTVANTVFHDINLSERRRNNYNEQTLNFFTHLFNRYAQ